MRLLLIVTLYNILGVILADINIRNEGLGDIHLSANVGNLPLRYMPQSEQDIKASEKAADVVDFIPLVPKIDPLNIQMVKPYSFEIPFLWLKGKVYLENFVVAGIKQLQLHGLELRLINLRSDINITIPKLYFEGDFHLRADLGFLPILYKCHISANLYEVAVAASSGGCTAQAPKIGEVLQINSAAVKVDIKDVVFNLTNMVVGEEAGNSDVADRFFTLSVHLTPKTFLQKSNRETSTLHKPPSFRPRTSPTLLEPACDTEPVVLNQPLNNLNQI